MNPKPLLTYLARYISLTAEEEALFVSRLTYRSCTKGEYLVRAGEVCQYERFVLSGCLKTFWVESTGQEHVVMFAIENWWTADLGSFLTQRPADYHVQCLEDTEVIQISYDTLQDLYVKIPKLERFFRIIIQKAYVASEKRVLQNMSLPANARYLLFRERYPQIEQRVPQYLIASYLGMSKEFLSKIRKQLSQAE